MKASLRGKGEREALRGGDTKRAGTAMGQEDEGRGVERGRMRLGSGMVKKGAGRVGIRYEGLGRGGGSVLAYGSLAARLLSFLGSAALPLMLCPSTSTLVLISRTSEGRQAESTPPGVNSATNGA